MNFLQELGMEIVLPMPHLNSQVFSKSYNICLEKEGNLINANVTLSSSIKHCVKDISLDIDSQYEELISMNRGINYAIILFMVLCFFCYWMIRQIKKVENHEQIAQRMSVITISWNIIWNFCFFNLYISYSFITPMSNQLMAPAFFYFMIWFLFELKLLLLCWRAENIDSIQEGQNTARRALIFFYCKFYCVLLAFFFLIDNIFRNSLLLLVVNGLVWVPQIYKNIISKGRNTPDLKFVISMTMTQCFLPLYIRACPNNIFLTKINYLWSLAFVLVILAQIAVLYLQKKFGARFFLPDKYKYWNEYNYYRNLEECDLEDGDTECWICLNLLSYLDPDTPNSDQTSRNGYRRIVYMQTPCLHKFHIECLKPWMQQKIKCNKCRADLPFLDEEDF